MRQFFSVDGSLHEGRICHVQFYGSPINLLLNKKNSDCYVPLIEFNERAVIYRKLVTELQSKYHNLLWKFLKRQHFCAMRC